MRSLSRRSARGPRAERHRAESLGPPAVIFAALGDETRLRLLARLRDDGPLSIATLADGFEISRQAISKHLRVINDAGLAASSRVGRETVWQLEPGGLIEAECYLQLIAKDWDAKLRRLKSLVESR